MFTARVFKKSVCLYAYNEDDSDMGRLFVLFPLALKPVAAAAAARAILETGAKSLCVNDDTEVFLLVRRPLS